MLIYQKRLSAIAYGEFYPVADNIYYEGWSKTAALKGLGRMLHTVQMVFSSRSGPSEMIIVSALFDKRTKSGRDSLLVMRESYPEHVWRSVIPVDVKKRNSSLKGVSAPLIEPNSKAVIAYAELLELLLLNKRQD